MRRYAHSGKHRTIQMLRAACACTIALALMLAGFAGSLATAAGRSPDRIAAAKPLSAAASRPTEFRSPDALGPGEGDPAAYIRARSGAAWPVAAAFRPVIIDRAPAQGPTQIKGEPQTAFLLLSGSTRSIPPAAMADTAACASSISAAAEAAACRLVRPAQAAVAPAVPRTLAYAAAPPRSAPPAAAAPWIAAGVCAIAAVALFCAYAAARRDIRRMERAVRQLSEGRRLPDLAAIRPQSAARRLAAAVDALAERLDRLTAEERERERYRQDMLANVSHELRTPLTAMQGFLEAFQDGLVSEAAKPRYIRIMHRETLHLKRLTEDLTDLIRLENEELRIQKKAVEVLPVLRHVASTLEPKAAEKGSVIAVEAREPLLPAYADPVRLEQIVRNLAKNAVKFTEQGHITLAARNDGHDVCLTVQDTGIGISADDQERIWDRFYQAEPGKDGSRGGAGLGLAIVRRLVGLHQGQITIQSGIGRGTTIHVRLPAAARSDDGGVG